MAYIFNVLTAYSEVWSNIIAKANYRWFSLKSWATLENASVMHDYHHVLACHMR